jgi:hypothetical protein
MHPDDARRRLQKTFPLTNHQWELIDMWGLVDELTDDVISFDDFKQEVQALFERPRMRTRSARRDVSDDRLLRLDALSELLAEHAREFRGVTEFRNNELSGQLIEWANLSAWIQARAEEAGEPTRYATVPLDDDDEPLRDGNAQIILMEVHAEMLRYAGKDDKWSNVIATRRGHVLDRVRRIATRLVRAYPWTEAQAVAFLLTDITPLANDIRITSPGPGPMFDGVSHPWMRQISMTIDPALPADEVAAAYTKVRKDANYGDRRKLSKRQLLLTTFALKHQHLTWRERFELWNRQHPDMQYSQTNNFRRDAYAARDYLLGYR